MITSVHSACSAHAQSVFIATATNGSCGNTTPAHCPHTYIHIYTYLTNSRSSALSCHGLATGIYTHNTRYTQPQSPVAVLQHMTAPRTVALSAQHTQYNAYMRLQWLPSAVQHVAPAITATTADSKHLRCAVPIACRLAISACTASS